MRKINGKKYLPHADKLFTVRASNFALSKILKSGKQVKILYCPRNGNCNTRYCISPTTDPKAVASAS